MCGIAGILNLSNSPTISLDNVLKMTASLAHRGPDETGIYVDDHIALGQTRLSIIDLEGGSQPMHNENKTLWVVFNGEIFNYIELREELVAKGHQFYTHSDTEVILHAFEEYGPDCLSKFNGQFAIALWNSRTRELFLARDRIGIRPVHYTVFANQLIFASEIKAIFSLPHIPRAFDAAAIDQIFTFWTTLPGKTAFQNICELPPGHWLAVKNGKIHIQKWWSVPFVSNENRRDVRFADLVEQTKALLDDSIRLRLRADVPVGCYLSGGLDSSGITARVVRKFNSNVNTFGIRFEDADFDEGKHQQLMVKTLGVKHTELVATNADIGRCLSDTLFFCEKPLLRTGPIPLFLLSQKVQQANLKVVLTGEGADEFFGGYNIYRETKARMNLSRFPQSQRRGNLLHQLYPYIFKDAKSKLVSQSFFERGIQNSGSPLFSHLLRWENTRRTQMFFSPQLRAQIDTDAAYTDLQSSLPPDYESWDYFSKAQYLETQIFLSNYLLSSQGDRVAMAHSIEIRMPFLDYRMMELTAQMSSRWKILGMKEKYLLKKVFGDTLPEEILNRPKHPYRAPIVSSLLNPGLQAHQDALSETELKKTGLFDTAKVSRLVAHLYHRSHPSEVDSMALAGILSTQLLYRHFIEKPYVPPHPGRPNLLIDNRTAKAKKD